MKHEVDDAFFIIEEETYIEEKTKSLTFFDIMKDISSNTGVVTSYIEESGNFPEKEYLAFMINKGFSLHRDAILAANEMNIRHQLPAVAQFNFLKNILSKKNRFSKWPKLEEDEFLPFVAKYYKWTINETRKNYAYIPKEDIEMITKLYKMENENENIKIKKLTKRKK